MPHARVLFVLLLALGACAGRPERWSADDVATLAPGYARVHAKMQQFGCTACHTQGTQKIPNHFRPPAPGVDDAAGTRMLLARLDLPDLAECRLVRKPSARLPHKGGMILNGPAREEWVKTLRQWLAVLDHPPTA